MKLTQREQLAIGVLANTYAGAKVSSAFGFSPWSGVTVQLGAMVYATTRAREGKTVPEGVRLLLLPGDLIVSSIADREALEQPEGV